MFKVIVIGGLVYTLYKLVFPSKGIGPGTSKDSVAEDTIDIDHEEVD